jgi:hypothetical protein
MTTGQPIKNYGDRLKYNNEFMDTLRRQIRINDTNLKANRLYQQTGQLPPSAQMYDNRTTAEKLADFETVKSSIIADLAPIASPAFASAIIRGIVDSPLNVDNKLLRFLAQNSTAFAAQLSTKYKFGIEGDENDVKVMIEFLEDAYNKTRNSLQSIKNYYNSTNNVQTASRLLPQNNVDQIKKEIDFIVQKLKFTLQEENFNINGRLPPPGRNPQPVTPQDQYRANNIMVNVGFAINNLEELSSFIPNSQQMETILNDYVHNLNQNNVVPVGEPGHTGMMASEEILIVLDILSNLPKPSSLSTMTTLLEKAIRKRDDQLVQDLCNRLVQLFAPILQSKTRPMMQHFRNFYLTRAQHELNEESRISRIQETQAIRAESQAERDEKRAQRVYVINPRDDPVNVGMIAERREEAEREPGGESRIPPERSLPDFSGAAGGGGDSIIAPSPSAESSYFPSASTFATLLAGGIGLGAAGYASYQYLNQPGGGGGASYPSSKYVQPDFDYDFLDEYISSDFEPGYPPPGIPEHELSPLERPVKGIPGPPKPPKPSKKKDEIPPEMPSEPGEELSSTDKLRRIIADLDTQIKKSSEGRSDFGGGAEISKGKESFNPEEKFKAKKDYLSETSKMNRKSYIDQNVDGLEERDLLRLARIVLTRESQLNPGKLLSRANEFIKLKNELTNPRISISKVRKAVKAILISSKSEYDPQNGKLNMGVGGLGIKKGRGIYRPLGDIEVNNKNLEKGILTVRRKTKSNFIDFPSKHVSNKMTKIINQIVGGSVPSFEDMNSLSEEEKQYLHKLVSKSNLSDRLSVPAPSKDQMEKDFHSFEVMKGEILSGNDSTELVKKFKLLLMKLSRQNLLPRNEVNELMEDLISLGY